MSGCCLSHCLWWRWWKRIHYTSTSDLMYDMSGVGDADQLHHHILPTLFLSIHFTNLFNGGRNGERGARSGLEAICWWCWCWVDVLCLCAAVDTELIAPTLTHIQPFREGKINCKLFFPKIIKYKNHLFSC